MRVILLSDVAGTGQAGDLLEVKEGFARNYLLPKGLAEVPSSEAAKKILIAKNEKMAAEKKRKIGLEKSVGALTGRKVTLKVKINAQGNPYRAVTKKDVALALGVEPKLVEEINLKKIGQFPVKIKSGTQTSVISLEIKPEK